MTRVRSSPRAETSGNRRELQPGVASLGIPHEFGQSSRATLSLRWTAREPRECPEDAKMQATATQAVILIRDQETRTR
jgi:hypothetical protein